MELIISFISLAISIWVTLSIGYMVHGSWKGVKRLITKGDDTFVIFLAFMTFMIFFLFLVLGFAFNNSIWHIDYITTQGLWY